jgi:hypothetical protein
MNDAKAELIAGNGGRKERKQKPSPPEPYTEARLDEVER